MIGLNAIKYQLVDIADQTENTSVNLRLLDLVSELGSVYSGLRRIKTDRDLVDPLDIDMFITRLLDGDDCA